jgi:acyl carrier protein
MHRDARAGPLLTQFIVGDFVEDRIRELFAAILQINPAQISDSTAPAVLDRWDSMQHLILVSGMEEEFGVEFEPEEAVDMYKDFATFKHLVLAKLGARN